MGIAIVVVGECLDKITVALEELRIPVLWQHGIIDFGDRRDAQIVDPLRRSVTGVRLVYNLSNRQWRRAK